VLLHRVSASASPEQRAASRTKADAVLAECLRLFGSRAVVLIEVAVDDAAPAAAAALVEPSRVSATSKRNTLRPASSQVTLGKDGLPHASSRPSSKSRPTGAAAAAAAGKPAAAARTLAEALNGEGMVTLRTFLAAMYENGVVAQYRKQLGPLAEHVAQKRSKISSIRAFLSGNKNKPKPGAADPANLLNRSLEEQTRRLADTHFLLRDWDNAQQQYKAAAGDFKNEKLHEAYASAQEMAAATMLAEAPRTVAAVDKRQMLNVVAHLNNAFNSYERAGAVHLAQRASIVLQLLLRAVGEHLQAADACLRAIDIDGTDDLYAAMMYEQSAIAYLHTKPKALFRRCTFRLVNAGACFDGAHQRAHALRCYATAFAAYKTFGWPIINEQLHSLLVRHYAMQGQLDNALHFALALLESHATTPPAVQASHLREYLYLHQAVHAASSESRARAIAQYADAADRDDAEAGEYDDGDDYGELDMAEVAALSSGATTAGGEESSADDVAAAGSGPALPRTRSTVDAGAAAAAAATPIPINLPDPPTLPLPIVHNDVEFVFQDSSTSSSTAAGQPGGAPLASLSVTANEADVLGTVTDEAVMWPTLEARLLRNAQRQASSMSASIGASGTQATQVVDERLPRGSALFKLWMRDANEALGVVRPISVVQEPITVTVSVTNPLGVPVQLSRVRLLASLELLDGSKTASRDALRTEPSDVLLEPREKVQLVLALTPLAVGLLHVRGVAFTVAGQVDGACIFGQLSAASSAVTFSASGLGSAAAATAGEQAAPRPGGDAASARAATARAACAQQVLVAPPMPLMESVLSDVPTHLCAGERACLRLRVRNVGQRSMCNVWVTSNLAQNVWFGGERGEAKRFCAPVRVPGGKLLPGASHELLVWLRAPHGDVATGELARLVMRVALAFYYAPASEPAAAPAGVTSLAYRFQRLQARIELTTSLRLAYMCASRPGAVDTRLLRLSVHNKWRSGVFRISRVTARSARWSLQLALPSDVTDINDVIVRPDETAHVLLVASPQAVDGDDAAPFVAIDLSGAEATAAPVADQRGASNCDVWLQPVNDAVLATVRGAAGACDFFYEGDVRAAALRSALASGANVTATTIDGVARRANWCDIVVHWELVNARGRADRFGQLSLCDVRLDRGPLSAADSSLDALRERRLSATLLDEPTLAIEHVRFAIEAPARVAHDFALGPCVQPVTVHVYNGHPTQAVAFVLQLLKPHEQMLVDATANRIRRRTRFATSPLPLALGAAASNALVSRAGDAGLRRAAANCAARAAGPGSGGGGGARAKGSCLFIGVQQRGPFALAPRGRLSIVVLACFPEAGVHNVARMRVAAGALVLPADSQTLVVVQQEAANQR
jgi:tetratricopeptide (TPR) repeat protein